MTHPQATIALLAGKSEITAHFGVAPYYYEEMADPALHVVLKSYDVLGGPHMNGVLITTKRFHDNNPKLHAAIIAEQREANALIKGDPPKAAATYLRLANDKKSSLEAMTGMVSDPDFDYTIVPLKVGMFAESWLASAHPGEAGLVEGSVLRRNPRSAGELTPAAPIQRGGGPWPGRCAPGAAPRRTARRAFPSPCRRAARHRRW
jgi:ABC-type nitrate/sulfonate/bicarbonate transport system substrate-binding protein